jgi:hypothetical protein
MDILLLLCVLGRTYIFHIYETSEILRCKNSYESEHAYFNTALNACSNTALRLSHIKKALVYLLHQPFKEQHCKRAEHPNFPRLNQGYINFPKI